MLLKADWYLAGVFIALCAYTIFAQVGYLFYPELSQNINAYFGPHVYRQYIYIVGLSLAGVFIVFLAASSILPRCKLIAISTQPTPQPLMLLLPISGFVSVLAVLVLVLWKDLTYQYFGSAVAQERLSVNIYIFTLKLMVPLILLLYFGAREGLLGKNPWWMVCGVFGLFAVFAGISGNRTDLVAVACGVGVYEGYTSWISNRRKLIKQAILWSFVLVLVLAALSRTRAPHEESGGIVETLIAQDWYAPSHVLFGAVAYGVIDPLLVLQSNAANALARLGVPYLSPAVTDHFAPGASSRSAGYAFYVLSEGYMFSGPLGWMYNIVIVGLGFVVWRLSATSDNPAFNRMMLILMGAFIINLARSQSSYFIKYYWTIIIPSVMLGMITYGFRICRIQTPVRPLKRGETC